MECHLHISMSPFGWVEESHLLYCGFFPLLPVSLSSFLSLSPSRDFTAHVRTKPPRTLLFPPPTLPELSEAELTGAQHSSTMHQLPTAHLGLPQPPTCPRATDTTNCTTLQTQDLQRPQSEAFCCLYQYNTGLVWLSANHALDLQKWVTPKENKNKTPKQWPRRQQQRQQWEQ